jgi:hypothetical protein
MKSFNFLVMLMFMKNVMGKTKCLTTEVQGIDMNIIDTIESFKATITTLEHIRNDSEGLGNQIQSTKSVAEQHGIAPDENITGITVNARSLAVSTITLKRQPIFVWWSITGNNFLRYLMPK